MPVDVSVIIPTYNYANYIGFAIDSVFSQNYPEENIEIIVVDDGSTDNTREILQSFIDEKRVEYFYQENRGKASATSFAIGKAKGKYIFNLDADDYFFPDKIASTINIFESNPDIVHVASPASILDQKKHITAIENIPAEIIGKPVDGNWLLRYFYDSNILFGGGTTYAARSLVLKKINIPTDVDMYIDEFLILAVLPYGNSYFFGRPLSVWRIHGDNYSVKYSTKEYTIKRSQRLLKSSGSVLSFLEDHAYEKSIVKVYKLKNMTRAMAFKENTNDKTWPDIFQYAYYVFIVLRPSWKQIKNHHAMNRLIPTGLIHFLKRVKRITGRRLLPK